MARQVPGPATKTTIRGRGARDDWYPMVLHRGGFPDGS